MSDAYRSLALHNPHMTTYYLVDCEQNIGERVCVCVRVPQ